ncbi:MAG: hypothetical protein AAGA48_38800 [Myxococcota bacterium]
MKPMFSLGALLLASCTTSSDPHSGTFVGNPSLTARIADNPVQSVLSGQLDLLESHVTDCESTATPLGPRQLRFNGPSSAESIDLPVGDHCGLFFVVDLFTVTFEDEGTPITIVADDFDLSIPSTFVARDGNQAILRLGDERWLAEVATLAPSGETRLSRGTSPLADAFFEGLFDGSTVLSFE